MKKSVVSSAINGTVNAPASKSSMQRLIALSVLAEGEVVISNPEYCNDVVSALSAAEALGAAVRRQGGSANSSSSDSARGQLCIEGAYKGAESFRSLRSPSSSDRRTVINCGESGLGVRMFSSVAALFHGEYVMTGEGSLLSRPAGMITDSLQAFGVSAQSSRGFLPVTVKGPIAGGSASIDGSLSSQVLTGLLISLPLAASDSVIHVHNLKSRPYIDMTIELVEKFGGIINNNNYSVFEIPGNQKYLSPGIIEAEGDWSGAAFIFAAAALAGYARVNNLNRNSTQADKAMLDALIQTGAGVLSSNNFVEVTSQPVLSPFEIDASDCPDLFPPLVSLASGCRGISRIHGVGRLKHKESDREKTLISEFTKAGIHIESDNNTLKITGGDIRAFVGNSHNDHRIAMALAAAAVRAKGEVVIENAEAVNKSYPRFYDDLASLGGKIL